MKTGCQPNLGNLRWRWRALAVLSLALPSFLWAHGTHYHLLAEGLVGIRATYDNGAPLAHAKALVFAPGETTPTLTLPADADGVVCFRPHRAGLWIVQIRSDDGHGVRVNLTIDDTLRASLPAAPRGGPSGPQKLLMAACVVWGFLGVALYTKARQTRCPPPTNRAK